MEKVKSSVRKGVHSPSRPPEAGCASSPSGCLWPRPRWDRCRRGWPAALPTCAAATCPSGRWTHPLAAFAPVGPHSLDALEPKTKHNIHTEGSVSFHILIIYPKSSILAHEQRTFCNDTYDGSYKKMVTHYMISVLVSVLVLLIPKPHLTSALNSTMDTALLSHATRISVAFTCGSHWTLKALML